MQNTALDGRVHLLPPVAVGAVDGSSADVRGVVRPVIIMSHRNVRTSA